MKKNLSQGQTAMRVMPTVKYNEARALLERGRVEKLEAELQKRLNVIKGVDEDGRPRVVVSIEDRTLGRKPWTRQVPHTHRATHLREYLDALEIAWGNVRASQEQVDVLMNQIHHYLSWEDRDGILLSVAKGELKLYDRSVRIERGYAFAEGHARPNWHVWRHRRDKGDTWGKNHFSFKVEDDDMQATVKKLKPFLRESGKWLIEKHGDRLKEFVLQISGNCYVLYGLVALSPEEIAKAQEEAEINRRLRDAEKVKLADEAAQKGSVPGKKALTLRAKLESLGIKVKKWRKPRKMPVEVHVGQTKKLTPRQEAGL